LSPALWYIGVGFVGSAAVIFFPAFVACVLVYWPFVILAFSTSCARLLMKFYAVSKKKKITAHIIFFLIL